MHLLVDRTGLKLCGAGEWLIEKHGTKTCPAWRKLHNGMDVETGEIVAAVLTTNDVDDASQVGRIDEQRQGRVEGHLRARIPTWWLFPLVQNLCALRGLDMIGAAGVAAAIGDPSRFASAPDFMAHLGMVPSEHS